MKKTLAALIMLIILTALLPDPVFAESGSETIYYGNMMVDLVASNQKLKKRALRLTMEATGASEEKCAACLQEADGHVKTAILMVVSGMTAHEAKKLLAKHEGHLRKAIQQAMED